MKSTPAFRDHFSGHSIAYEKYRPRYPKELFAWLAANAPARDLAVDVATGNGQAAIALAEFFDGVVATDASAAQLKAAETSPRVRYQCEPAERISLPDASANLIVIAQAAHWFDWPAFQSEARRVLRPGGLLALWCYGNCESERDIDRLFQDYSRNVVGPYWPRERRYVEENYRDLPLPFPEIAVPRFEMQADWDIEAVLGYLGTWSATQRCRQRSGRDPLALLAPLLTRAWGSGTRRLQWPLVIKAGRR
ncbi:MAG: class I SAM-dependent methyltransferase [Steroidobacteraceae bacterium]